MKDLIDFTAFPQPTSERPLLGHTVLLVEDSRYTCEAVRLMCLRSGARIRRADCLQAAGRHLQSYAPSVVVIDLGLPDGSGLQLISELSGAVQSRPVVLAISGDPGAREAAIRAGADGFLDKPLGTLAVFQRAILDHLPANQRPPILRRIGTDTVQPDSLSLRDDMAHIADILQRDDRHDTVDYIAQFLGGVALSCGDADLGRAAAALRNARRGTAASRTALRRIERLVHDRMDVAAAI